MKREYDFAGWVTKHDIQCSDGVTIKHDAFRDNDGQRVPLVWNHDYNSPLNVLGHMVLEHRDIGVYGYGYLNDTQEGNNAKSMISHGDVTSMSIGARKLKRSGTNVVHGSIYEVSLVLAGANPGALIDTVIKHSDSGEEEEGVIYTGTLLHSSDDILNDSEGENDLTKQTDNLKHAIKGGTTVVDWANGSYDDRTGHGTLVASMIIAKDGVKPIGIAPDVDLYSVLATSSEHKGSAYASDLARGIEWAIENDMDAVNISFGIKNGSYSFSRIATIAKNSDIFIAVSAGNDVENKDQFVGICDDDVYCISSLDRNGQISYFSGYGVNNVKFGAAGERVTVVVNNGGFSASNGTSLAAPVAVGVYALHKSEHRNASVPQIVNHLEKTAIKKTVNRPIGNGKINYEPLVFGSNDNVLATWNYYYKNDKLINFHGWESLRNSQISKISYELWTVDLNYPSLYVLSFVTNMGIKYNVTADTSHGDYTMTLNPGTQYLIKTIVDFKDGSRQWQYDSINGAR